MKTINELLNLLKIELLKEEIENCPGLCVIAKRMTLEEITFEEYTLLITYLLKNVKTKRKRRGCMVWWKFGLRAPRMRWLNKHIKLTQN